MPKVVMPGPLTPEEIEEMKRLHRELGGEEPPEPWEKQWEGEKLKKAIRIGELLCKAKAWFEPPPSN